LHLADRLHHGEHVKASLIALACAGCLYTAPINDEPVIDSVTRACATLPCDQTFADVHRGDAFLLAATFHDPDGPASECRYQWAAVACNAGQTQCDPIDLKTDAAAANPQIAVPNRVTKSDEPVQIVRVTLELFDGRGAHATAVKTVAIVEGPSLAVRDASIVHTVGGPIALFATYGDPDGVASSVSVTWAASLADTPGAPFTQGTPSVLPDPSDPTHLTASEQLVLSAPGTWTVAVTATDDFGQMTEQDVSLPIAADTLPCIAATDPIATPDGALLPISAPTRFAVPLVTDDLDPYPAVPGQPLFGTPLFLWSILPPGAGDWQPFGAGGNSVELDPSAFDLGDQIGVRVEIEDRNRVPVTCDPDEATCGTATCVQRQTWQVEAR
jgi:hypothetical protein